MPEWGWITVAIYALGMGFIFCYSLIQLALLIRYRRKAPHHADYPPDPAAPAEWPRVLIQLPVYNERYVVERLIDAAARLDYPPDKLTIQVLDDSDDDGFAIAAQKVNEWTARGVDISHVMRPRRLGFKAGALQYGLGLSDHPFVAVFDADFLPPPDFLRETIPRFHRPEVGMVQTRWGHTNRDYSLLTRVQALALDAHFTVEQTGRNRGGHFINFNGTAGVWRRSCIDASGGWSPDTLTEDLDLSYRAQLRGWKFVFVEQVVSPAELPAEIAALRNQQYRWNKGAAECAVKHLGRVLTAPGLTASTRVHAVFHLLNSSIFIWILLCAIVSPALLWLKMRYPAFDRLFLLGGLLLVSFVILSGFYFTSFARLHPRRRGAFLWLYPAFLAISMGMSLHNARAVLLGFAGRRTDFIRTPKWNITRAADGWKNKAYLSTRVPALVVFEAFLFAYFAAALVVGIAGGEWGFAFLHALLVFGFGAVVYFSVSHARGT